MMLSWILLAFSLLLIVVVAIHDLAQKKKIRRRPTFRRQAREDSLPYAEL